MKTAELTGALLDEWVARALGWIDYPTDSVEHGSYWHTDAARAPFGPRLRKHLFTPSADWAEGGPIIESHPLQVGLASDRAGYQAFSQNGVSFRAFGPTPLVAAVRCFVGAKFGDEVAP